MGDDASSQMSYQQHSGESMLNCPSSGMNARPMTMHPVYGPGWNPVVSPRQSGSFGASSMVTRAELTNSPSFPISHENHGISGPSHLLNYPSDPNLAQLLPNFSMFGSENSHELANPYCLPPGSQNHNALFPRNYASTENGMDEKPSLHTPQAKRGCQVSEARTVGVSPKGKRRRDSEPNSPVNKTIGDVQKDHSCEPFRSKEPDDKRQKSEHNNAASSSDKQESKQVEDNSQGEEASKQDYIHVRARRGQATNSHSLAERVRREKISERMRLLQELVPGCNKITGKAVMLDEIINYVQSLQQQVEFLSMKLATVNPEVNFDIERLLTKDILHSRGSGQPILGFDQGMGSSHGFPLGVIHQNMTTMPNASQYHHLPQAVWDGDLQSLLQMGFDPNTTNGASKTEL